MRTNRRNIYMAIILVIATLTLTLSVRSAGADKQNATTKADSTGYVQYAKSDILANIERDIKANDQKLYQSFTPEQRQTQDQIKQATAQYQTIKMMYGDTLKFTK